MNFFYFGEGKVAIIHAGFRMGCIQLNIDLYKIGVVELPCCSCGATSEDVYHFYFQCNKYVDLRDEMQSKIDIFRTFNWVSVPYLMESMETPHTHNQNSFEAILT